MDPIIVASKQDDQSGKEVDPIIVPATTEKDVGVVDKEGPSKSPKVMTPFVEDANICTGIFTEPATYSCFDTQAVVSQYDLDGLEDTITVAPTVDPSNRQIDNLELMAGKENQQARSARQLEQNTLVIDISHCGVLKDLLAKQSSAVADIFNLDPIIQQVSEKLQHEEGL